MTRSWGTLPMEILQILFSKLLEANSVQECQYVCKGWLVPAQQEIYGKIELSFSKLYAFLKALESSKHRVGKFVRKLYLHQDRDEDSWVAVVVSFLSLVELCPNVKVFEVEEMPDELWPEFLKAIERGYWRNIKIIPPPGSIFNLEYYTNIVIKCQKLEAMTLLCWNNLSDENSAYVVKLAEKLNWFKALKNLEIQTFAVLSDLLSIESVVKIESCPSLKSVSLRATYPSILLSAFDVNMDIALVQPSANIMSFDGRIVISENTLRYIIHKFPGLNRLKLELVVGGFFLTRPVGVPVSHKDIITNQFINYLSKIQFFDLSLLNIQDSSNFLTRYFNTMDKLHNKVKIHFTDTTSEANFYPDIVIKNHAEREEVFWEETTMTNIVVSRPTLIQEGAESLSRLEITKYLGANIKSLHLSCAVRESILHDKKVFERIIEEAIKNCTSLKTLFLTNITMKDSQITHNALETIVMEIYENEKRELILSSTNLPCLKYISVLLRLSADGVKVQKKHLTIWVPLTDVVNVSLDMPMVSNKPVTIIIWVSFSINDEAFFSLDDEFGFRKSSRTEFNSFLDTENDSSCFDICSVHIFCKSMKSFTREVKSRFSYPTTYLLDTFLK
ncbi:hypothetical protein BD770DRAFT_403737 [Pilaira anomala]|nr:hypothetical protein BD770DRAFT_403737 [Pilaira anomala]